MASNGQANAPPQEPWEIFQRYRVIASTKYGEGGYGATYAALDTVTNEALAVKVIDTRRMNLNAIQREAHILSVLTHPNVISVRAHSLGVDRHSHLYFIFMEVAAGGELFDKVMGGPMAEVTARRYFNQLLDALAYCHLAGVAHRDLKLENVLLTSTDENATLKLIDFGLAHIYPKLDEVTVDRSTALRQVCGSRSYAAPEVLANSASGYDGYDADMWSLGVCLFAMLSGFFPVDEASPTDWRYTRLETSQQSGCSTVATVFDFYHRSSTHLSPEVVSLLDGLLSIDPQQRLKMKQVREHPWVLDTRLSMQGVGVADQGSFDASLEVSGEDATAYRGYAMPNTYYMFDDIANDEEEPVYRSMSTSVVAAPVPVMVRQKAKSNLLLSESADDMTGLTSLLM